MSNSICKIFTIDIWQVLTVINIYTWWRSFTFTWENVLNCLTKYFGICCILFHQFSLECTFCVPQLIVACISQFPIIRLQLMFFVFSSICDFLNMRCRSTIHSLYQEGKTFGTYTIWCSLRVQPTISWSLKLVEKTLPFEIAISLKISLKFAGK